MMIFKEKLRTSISNQKRSYFGMEYEIIHPQTKAFIFVSFVYIVLTLSLTMRNNHGKDSVSIKRP